MTSQKEAKRWQVIEQLTAGKIDPKDAGKCWLLVCAKPRVSCGATVP
ncbi:hypothetical protein [Candidatus Nitrotoga sp. BS]|nr:hypothetical protein [Candidatus Nitrotoga sp. BS]